MIIGLLAIGIFVSGLAVSVWSLDHVRQFVHSFGNTPRPLLTGVPGNTPVDGPIWGGSERVNILLLGLDLRPGEAEATGRTDSMLVATIDPRSKIAGILSLPRDLWVEIPVGSGMIVEDRLNSTFVYAGAYRSPGGGPAVAKQTVSRMLGIPIHFVAWVNFEGFTSVVDRLGGIVVDVQRPVKDDSYPRDEDYGYKRIYFAPGLQHLDGEEALIYARTRHQDSDFYRASRQQQVMVAVRQRALQLDLLPKIPTLLGDMNEMVRTDMNPTAIFALARLAKDVDVSAVTLRTVPSYGYITSQGGDVQLVDRPALAKVVAELFSDPELDDANEPTVEVLNGTTTPLLATRWGQLLENRGYTVIRTDSADTIEQKQTAIVSARGTRQVAEEIASLLRVPSTRIVVRPPESRDGPRIRIVLGTDTPSPNSN